MRKFFIPIVCLLLLTGCGDKEDAGSASPTPTPVAEDPTPIDMPELSDAPQYDGPILDGTHNVVIKTTLGDISVELDADAAPKTVTNFVTLAKDGYYDDLIFHRVIPDFMVQGGDPSGTGAGGESIYGSAFEDEINADSYGLDQKKLAEVSGGQPLPPELKNASVKDYYELQGYAYNDDLESLPMDRGYLAMANRGPNTNGSQFFIIQREGGTEWLEAKHTVFGKVTDGMDVVDAIAAVERDGRDKPLEPVSYTVEVLE